MIKKKSILSMFSLFTIAVIMISAYATDAAANTTDINSTQVDTDQNNPSDKYVYNENNTDSAWSNSKLNTSNIQVRLKGSDDVITDEYLVEINQGEGWQNWNFTEYKSPKNNSMGVLTGLKPINNQTKHIDYTPILDAIGQEEAKFGNIQQVTWYGADDAQVMENYGYGDCWADASWLYNKLSAAGIPVRIMAYEDGGKDDGYRHTWIEINIGNGWQSWNYTKYQSLHNGDNGYGKPYVLIEPGNAPADIAKTGY